MGSGSRSRRISKTLIGTVLLLSIFFSSLFPRSESAVASIDLGSEWLKVAVVNLKPGQAPISVAINEMSKRKSPSLAGIQSGQRLLGEEATGVTARFPSKVFSHVRDMIGKPYSYVKQLTDSLYLPFDLVEDSRGTASFRTDTGEVFTVEEILAMILTYAMGLAKSHVGSEVKDALISVPGYFGVAERRGVMQAAQLAGINVLGLINEHAGAALQYGIDKDFANNSRYVVLYDMGAGSTYAALVHFSAYNTKEFGKTVSVNQFQVKDVRWNARLGGQEMELRLVEYFADEFNKQLGNGVDVRKNPKAMAKLKKQVKRTKEILSANTAAPISVESLYDDLDFRSTITREKFEELCGDFWDKALVPLEEVIKSSNLKVEDIYAVELIGGATRVPKLQAKLQEFLGKSDLDKHLDADEAIVLGASLHAANISDGIKLNRKLGMVDGSTYGFLLDVSGPDLVKEESFERLLVPRMKKMPIKMYRSIKHDKDFEVSLSYDSSNGLLPPGVSSHTFALYSVTGLKDAADKYSARNLSAPIKATMHFSLSRSGILSIDKADAVIEITEWVEVPLKKNLTLESIKENSTTTNPESGSTNNDATKDDNKDKDPEGAAKDGNSSSTNEEEKKSTEEIKTEKVLKKRTFRVPLKIVEKTAGPGSILSKEQFVEAKGRLEALDKKDAERRRTAELKNRLEEYTYSTREKLEENEDIKKVSTEEERKSLLEKLSEVQEWLYMDGEDAQAKEFEERLDLLTSIGDPIFSRLTELTARPSACEYARSYFSEVQKIVSNWETNKPWLPKSRIEEVLKEAEEVRSWLEEKETLQKNTPDYKTPVFTSVEVFEKVTKLQEKVASVNRIPKPKPKVEKPSKEEKVSKDETNTSGTTDKPDATSQKESPNEEKIDSPDTPSDSQPEQHDEL
ncbi:heat shock protein 70 [Rhynchospora pubera]|uniref:Heat shock protein 70 n=1 Tax=Rhynchospora pubera TaxID=906938 RepID=A0AAV8DTZ7_9POAL|nr:heat shock protein 70 [Rhynchospora pubera]KAJ4781686.1 heat shock protein 70 [Rhynchospora pubera]